MRPPPHAAGRIKLAVLPLDNLSGDPQQEYLADGITEEITTELGNLDPEHLGVVARTSAMHHKRSQKTIKQIAAELGVWYLLEGSVRRSGPNVRVSAQLIQSRDQTHLWAKSYDRELSDLLNVERETASVVAREVGLTLSQAANQRVTAAPPVNADAIRSAELRMMERETRRW